MTFGIEMRLLRRWTREPMGKWIPLEYHANYETSRMARDIIASWMKAKAGAASDLRKNHIIYRVTLHEN